MACMAGMPHTVPSANCTLSMYWLAFTNQSFTVTWSVALTLKTMSLPLRTKLTALGAMPAPKRSTSSPPQYTFSVMVSRPSPTLKR